MKNVFQNMVKFDTKARPILAIWILNSTIYDLCWRRYPSHTCYVRVNQKFWHFECPLKTLEVCFKSYFVFHCIYPKECYDSWLIIQKHLFKFGTEYYTLLVLYKQTSITTTISAKMQSFEVLNNS